MAVYLYTDADVFAGTERHIFTLATALKRLNVSSVVICPGHSPLAEECRLGGIEVVALEKRGLVDGSAIKCLRRLSVSDESPIVHAHNGRCLLNAAIATRGRIPLVFTQHFLQPNHATQAGMKGLVYRLAHGWVNSKVNAFIAVSKAAADLMIFREKIEPNKVNIVSNGIDPVSPVALTAPGLVRSQFSVVNGQPMILCLARLEAEKQIENLIEAAHLLKQRGITGHFIVAGDGSLRGVLEQRIATLKLDNIKMVGFQSDALSLVNACDIFVLPSPAEPFGLVLLEAMALSKPIIAVNAGGPAEIVVSGETGLLTQTPKPEHLAEALKKLIADKSERKRLGEAGYQRFLQLFTADAMAAKTMEVYQSISGRVN